VASQQHSPARGQDGPAPDLPARAPVDLGRVIAEQERIFTERQPESARMAARARGSLAGGVTSSWQITAPQPVWLSHGRGSKIYDVDGNEYVDLHGGYGAALAGHAHPAIVEAVRGQVTRGTHFAQPTEDSLVVADELARRFGQPLWRFGNSGTEATMDAVHLMRAITGRDLIIKIEGCYHGHHDSVQVSVNPEPDQVGPASKPAQSPSSTGIPDAIIKLTLVASFNDLDSVARLLDEHPDGIAGMILEPIMMNAGIIHPEPGYLAALRDLLHSRGALLTFDEVKTGLTAGPSGATGLTGVVPDITCLAKSIGGGIAVAAVGGSEQVMEHVANGDYEQVGTFNGNPLAMAAARAMLCEVATAQAYERIERLRARAVAGLELEIARHGLAAHVVSAGAKGCVVFSPEPVRDYRGFLDVDDRYSQAHWLFQHNGGVFLPPWGKIEQWLISVQHDEGDIDRFAANFAGFARSIGR
jgi:glutamate-1-semialdehyde 2,1-aminomutase